MVRESLLKLVQFISIMLYVLVAGVMWGTWLSLARTMTGYDAAPQEKPMTPNSDVRIVDLTFIASTARTP
jgi:high-affinity Fe2+/Pb2+ permease